MFVRTCLARLGTMIVAAAALPSTAWCGGDFNGDGYDDLVVSAYAKDSNGIEDVGTVTVLYGSANGPTSSGAQWITPTTLADGFAPIEDGDFGQTLAIGNFDGDAFDDLAIGVPGDTVSGLENAGRVVILRGSATGLDLSAPVSWHQDSKGIKGKILPSTQNPTRADEYFGYELAAGDFDGDGRDDLAIRIPGEDTKKKHDIGGLAVLYGSSSGLRAKRNQLFTQDSKGMNGVGGQYSGFLSSMRAGDFNGDGRDDLAYTVTYTAFDADTFGLVGVLWGHKKSGLTTKKDRLLPPDGDGATYNPGQASSLLIDIADVNGDGFADLLVGTPAENVGLVTQAGVLRIFNGSAAGLPTLPSVTVNQDTAGFNGVTTMNGNWASTIAHGDFDGDGFDDLTVNSPGVVVNAHPLAGIVHEIPGSASGFDSSADQVINQDSMPAQQADDFDWFGMIMGTGDFNGDGFDDLAVGVPYEDTAGLVDSGCLHILYGSSANGLTTVGAETWTELTAGVPDSPVAHDFWALNLAR